MFYRWNGGSDLKIIQTLGERYSGGAGAVRDHTDLCQWLGQAWVSSTEWQTCRRQDESQWCCWAEPGEEPAGTPLQRWWWSQTGELRRKEIRIWKQITLTAIVFMFSFQTNITLQRSVVFYPFQGIRPPVHGHSSAADSSLCPTVGAGLYSLHSALHHLLSSSSYETTSSAANWTWSK